MNSVDCIHVYTTLMCVGQGVCTCARVHVCVIVIIKEEAMNLRGTVDSMGGVGEISSRKSCKYSTHMKLIKNQTNGEGSVGREPGQG